MTIEIVFFNASRLLPLEIELEIRAGIDDAIAMLSRHVKIENVGIAAILDSFTAAETGLGGWHFGPDACVLWIDEESSNLRVDPRRSSAAVVVHELHHVLRARSCPWKKKDLCAGEVIVREGLAVHCQSFIGYPDDDYYRGVPEDRIGLLLTRIMPSIADPDADWQWIYELNDLPPHIYKAMYPMGYYVVGRYFERTGGNPIDSIATPWQQIWEIGLAE